MVLFAVEVGSPQINVRERDGSKVAYGFAAGGLPDYDTTSPALPSRQGHLLRGVRNRGKLDQDAIAAPCGRNTLLSVQIRSRMTASLRATATRALAGEVRLASRTPQSFRSLCAFDRVISTPAASTR